MRTTRTSGSPDPQGPEHAHDSFVHAESFARAVDGGTDTILDPTLNRELALVAALRHSGTAILGPNASERDRIRQRIMAQLTMSEFPSVDRFGARRVGAAHRASKQRRAIPEETRGRLLVAAAAALCLLMSLSGMSLLLSRDALPGDALYTFKRSAESAELGLTFGEERKAFKHLEFANARVTEIEVLAEHADSSGTWSAGEDKFLQALNDFELDTTAGTRLLAAVAAAGGQDSILSPLRGWVEQQEIRLQAVRGALPLPASTRLDSTFVLLDRVIARVAALDQRSDCRAISSGTHDNLGLLPAKGGCESVSSSGASLTTPLPALDIVPGANPAEDGLVPGLLAPPAGAPAPQPGQSGEFGGLPPAPGDVLGTPGEPGSGPIERPSPENGSEPSILPLPVPGIPLVPLPELDDPHVE